jgi:HK97 gp10 family phage protein
MAELIDNSERVRREIQGHLVGGLNKANEFLMDAARDDAPVSSGTLRDGIAVVTEATESNPVAVGASRAPYSATVNRGSASRDAKPFWTQAWIRMKAGFGQFLNG